jgi:hypothetical protein
MSRRQSLALGVWLATRGAIAATGFVLAIVASALSVMAIVGASARAASRVPWFTAEIGAWAVGASIAIGGAWHAVRRDRDEGILALVRARGLSAASYVQGRVLGLAVVVAAAVAGPTLVAGLAAVSLARPPWLAVRVTLGALVYAVAFAATIAPLALAALSARTKLGGYLSLVAVLGVPEIAAPWTAAMLPPGWGELTSIPSALTAVGAVFASPEARVHAGRAAAGLLAIVAASVLVVVARLPSADPRGSA